MVVEEFIDYIGIQKRYSKRTLHLYSDYVKELREFISPEGDDEFLGELKPQVIRGFISAGLESGLSSRTVNLKYLQSVVFAIISKEQAKLRQIL